MGVKERRERNKENLRQEILDAAREMFATEGYQNVSMRKIADKIEYSPTTIYLYFKDKNELLNQVCDETFAELGGRISAIMLKEANPMVSLREGMREYINFGLENPKHYQAVFVSPIFEGTEPEDYTFEGSMGERTFSYLKTSVNACIENGDIKNGDVDLLSQTLWCGMHGVVSLLNHHKDFPFVDKNKLVSSILDAMINGLKR